MRTSGFLAWLLNIGVLLPGRDPLHIEGYDAVVRIAFACRVAVGNAMYAARDRRMPCSKGHAHALLTPACAIYAEARHQRHASNAHIIAFTVAVLVSNLSGHANLMHVNAPRGSRQCGCGFASSEWHNYVYIGGCEASLDEGYELTHA